MPEEVKAKEVERCRNWVAAIVREKMKKAGGGDNVGTWGEGLASAVENGTMAEFFGLLWVKITNAKGQANVLGNKAVVLNRAGEREEKELADGDIYLDVRLKGKGTKYDFNSHPVNMDGVFKENGLVPPFNYIVQAYIGAGKENKKLPSLKKDFRAINRLLFLDAGIIHTLGEGPGDTELENLDRSMNSVIEAIISSWVKDDKEGKLATPPDMEPADPDPVPGTTNTMQPQERAHVAKVLHVEISDGKRREDVSQDEYNAICVLRLLADAQFDPRYCESYLSCYGTVAQDTIVELEYPSQENVERWLDFLRVHNAPIPLHEWVFYRALMAACDMFDFYFMGVEGPMTLFDLKGVKDRCSYARVSFTAVAMVFHGGLHAPDDRKHLWLKEPPNMIAHQTFERCLRAGVLDPASGDVENPQPIGQVGIPRLKGTPHPYTTGRGL